MRNRAQKKNREKKKASFFVLPFVFVVSINYFFFVDEPQQNYCPPCEIAKYIRAGRMRFGVR